MVALAFKAFPRFNAPERRPLARCKQTMGAHWIEHFPGEGLTDRIARSLVRHRAISAKELLESAECFARIRRRTRATHMADLCCGHGLTGLLFAAHERGVETVTLLDRAEPPAAARVLDAVTEVAPWVAGKVRRARIMLSDATDALPPAASLVAVHACGARTDRCIDIAIELGGPVALMPCCYNRAAPHAPRAIRAALGAELTADIDRTYRLEAAGYRVDWSAIPEAVTPRNRILIAWRPR